MANFIGFYTNCIH